MRMLKCEGALFKWGVTESVAYQWIKGLVFTKDIVEGMEEFTGTAFERNYQHKDATDARMKKDHESPKKLEKYFCQYNPFSDVNAVVNIANKMRRSENVNCHNAFEGGLQIMRKIVGQILRI